MTHPRTALWAAVNAYAAACDGDTSDRTISVERMAAAAAVERAVDALTLAAAAEMSASLEAGVRGDETTIYPNWVYESRQAVRHQNESLPWLPDLLAALGWQGGTIHEALNAVARLAAEGKRRETERHPHGTCFSCGWPNKADGCCSRRGCCNSD